MLIISILPLNLKNGSFRPQILHFWTEIVQQEKSSDNFLTSQNLRVGTIAPPPCHDATEANKAPYNCYTSSYIPGALIPLDTLRKPSL